MRSSTIHALACAFLNATLHLTGCLFRLSLSCMSACMSASWFMCHRSLKIKSEENFSPIFQTFSFLLLVHLPFFCPSQRSSLCASCQVSSRQGSARDFPHRAAVGVQLLGTCSSETTAGESIITSIHTPGGWSSILNMHSNLWVSNCWEDGCWPHSGFW